MRQIALLLCLLLVYSAPAGLLASTAPPAEPGGDYPVPTGAAPGGATSERSAAWNGLTSTGCVPRRSRPRRHVPTTSPPRTSVGRKIPFFPGATRRALRGES